MKRSLFVVAAAMVVASLAPRAASAHTIVVDGSFADWTMVAPTNVNTGHIGRNVAFEGEYVWNDATGDERTDFATPDTRVDIDTFAVTSDLNNLYFLIRMVNIDVAAGDGAPQVQIAIDLDGIVASGNVFFGGFADTSVASAAAWEFLVQTRFGSGSAPAVFNTSFTDVASGTASFIDSTTETIEIAIPWTNFGFAAGAGPTAPARFTVATFRGNPTDGTFDIGGASVSNALDVVSSYGNPSIAAPLANTFVEVSDTIVDYRFELWFHIDVDREPSSPILISEVLYNTGALLGAEGLEIFNTTAVDLPLAGYRIGDEETVDSTEGMRMFPAATLRAGHVAAIANDTATYAMSGRNPDFEYASADPFVPNLTIDATWQGAGTINMAAAGDEILLLDPYYTVIDVMTYGTGTYPGVTAHAGSPLASSLIRSHVRRDRNSSTDWIVGTPPTPAIPALPCLAEVSGNVPDGTACDDGLACNGGEICTAGACGGGSAVVCPPDANPCTQNTCTVAFNGCYPPEPGGTACDDGILCTTGTTCSAPATCGGGSAVVCPPSTNACQLVACDPVTACFASAGTMCDDTDMCTTMDACDAAGTCLPGGTLTCNDSNLCTNDSCAPPTGCVFTPNTDPCNDGNACTTADTCAGGACAGGPPLSCVDGNTCTDDSCAPASGCVFTNNTAPCSDGSMCTTADACSAGACAGGPPLSCVDGNVCTDDSCAPATGCVFTNNTAPCTDGNMCTTADACSAGACAGGPPLSCVDGNVCTDDACVPASGCAFTNNTAPCSDGDMCTTGDVCAAGSCTPGGPTTCNDGNPCTADSCSPSGGCVFDPVPLNGMACDDGLFCVTGSVCGAGACGGGAPTSCSDGNACTADSCNETTNACEFDATAANGSACDDGLFCTTATTCTAGACGGGSATDCTDLSACTVDTCDEAGDTCDNDPVPLEGAGCDDGDFCTVSETCQSGACAGGTPNPCSDLEGCTTDTCSVATQLCVHTPVADGSVCAAAGGCFVGGTCSTGVCSAVTPAPSGTVCDDADLCTTLDVCDGAGLCGGAPITCDDLNACTANACDPASGCTFPALADGTACDDGLFCTSTTTCVAGACGGGTSTDCADVNTCTADACDEAGDQCTNDTAPLDGASCDDGDGCTSTDVCSTGACMGAAIPGCGSDAGTDAATGTDASTGTDGATGTDAATGTDGATNTDAASDGGGTDAGPANVRGGCARCAVTPGADDGPAPAGALLVLALGMTAVALRRRRR